MCKRWRETIWRLISVSYPQKLEHHPFVIKHAGKKNKVVNLVILALYATIITLSSVSLSLTLFLIISTPHIPRLFRELMKALNFLVHSNLGVQKWKYPHHNFLWMRARQPPHKLYLTCVRFDLRLSRQTLTSESLGGSWSCSNLTSD